MDGLNNMNENTKTEFIKCSENRIHEFAEASGEVIGPMTATAILSELKPCMM